MVWYQNSTACGNTTLADISDDQYDIPPGCNIEGPLAVSMDYSGVNSAYLTSVTTFSDGSYVVPRMILMGSIGKLSCWLFVTTEHIETFLMCC